MSVRSRPSPLAAPLTANVVMALASCLAALGATRALLAARRLPAAGPASS